MSEEQELDTLLSVLHTTARQQGFDVVYTEDSQYVVVKKDGGKVIGTHASKAKANRQLRALHANTKK